MSSRKFKFISPGVFTREVDQSQVPSLADGIGPAVIGLATKGPALVPIQVSSYKEFVETFGEPYPASTYSDVWREPGYAVPSYAAYAAKAYLRNGAPLTFVRLLGDRKPSSETGAASYAGWKIGEGATTAASTNGGAYGLFIFPSGSLISGAPTGKKTATSPGALGAVFYVNAGGIALKHEEQTPMGLASGQSTAALVSCSVASPAGPGGEWDISIFDDSGANTENIKFNFSKDSPKYIRKVFNTDPTKLNSTINSSTKTYFLGETYASHLEEVVTAASASSGKLFATILALQSASADYNYAEKRMGLAHASTGWVFSQATTLAQAIPSANQKLFKFHAINAGDYDQSKIKVSIDNIKYSKNPDATQYGSFDVVVRHIADFDHKKVELERFSNVNINPRSDKYIAKVIGDVSYEWDYSQRRYRELGKFANNSKYIRVEMNEDVEKAAVTQELLPFGYYSAPRLKNFTLMSGSTKVFTEGQTDVDSGTESTYHFAYGADDIFKAKYLTHTGQDFIFVGNTSTFTGSVSFPKLKNRVKTNNDLNLRKRTDAYFGFDVRKSQTSTSPVFDEDVVDILRKLPGTVPAASQVTTDYFSLDEVKQISSDPAEYEWELDSWLYTTSYTNAQGSYKAILDVGHDKFTMPLFGGFDGLNITERNPFRNNQWTSNSNELNSSTFSSVVRAIDSVSDPDVVDMNILSVPGIWNEQLTNKVINVCEQRQDALGIIDIEGGYTPSTDTSSAETSRTGSVSATTSSIESRRLNSSFAAAYYPWVLIRDESNGSNVWVPPSVAALGTMAYTEATSELWFAPAGFNRGGLSQGTSGLTVIGVRDKLTSDDRDDLYAVNVNPIASFPAEGIVIFGQKTLQATPSALDRINVRRLLIFLKKRISRIANTILFDQNVKQTWDRFKGIVEPFLESVKNRLGLAEYKLILDETTTTPDLVDRNILYAKVYLKPARAIEFIALDFFITNSGASFEDL